MLGEPDELFQFPSHAPWKRGYKLPAVVVPMPKLLVMVAAMGDGVDMRHDEWREWKNTNGKQMVLLKEQKGENINTLIKCLTFLEMCDRKRKDDLRKPSSCF